MCSNKEMINLLKETSTKTRIITSIKNDMKNLHSIDYSQVHIKNSYKSKDSIYNDQLAYIDQLQKEVDSFYSFVSGVLSGLDLMFVIDRYFNGLSCKEIANKYNYSYSTIVNKLKNCYSKLAGSYPANN